MMAMNPMRFSKMKDGRRQMKAMLSYEDWLIRYGGELDIGDAESGRDRELDYEHNYDRHREDQYAKYIEESFVRK